MQGHKYLKSYRPEEAIAEPQSSTTRAFLRNNIFALSRLLKAPPELENDQQLLRKYASREVQWDKYTRSGSGIGYQDTHYLKVHHMLQMEVYSALLTAVSVELNDCHTLVSTLLRGSLLQLVEVTIRPTHQTKVNHPAKKASTVASSRKKTAESRGGYQSSTRSSKGTPQKVETKSGIIAHASAEQLKPMMRIELAGIAHLGVLVKAYRMHTWSPQHDSPFWVKVPPWMLPAYYWGRRAKPNFAKRHASADGCTNDQARLQFEEKVTDWAATVVSLLAKKANRRLYDEKKVLEEELLDVHRKYMQYEDKRSEVVEITLKNKSRQEKEALEWEAENRVWYMRIYNRIIGKKKVSFYTTGASPEEIETMVKNALSLCAALPSSMSPPNMALLNRKPINTVHVDCAVGDIMKLSLKGRHEKNKVHRKKARIGHVSWLSDVGDGRSRQSRRAVIPTKFVQWLCEMFVGGGFRSVLCIARAVMDFDNNPSGSAVMEPMTLYSIAAAEDMETVQYVRSCRVGFQDRDLCEARCDM